MSYEKYQEMLRHVQEMAVAAWDTTDRLLLGYRRGKSGWIKPSYKGKGRPRKSDYDI